MTIATHRWAVSEDSAGLFPIHTGTAATVERAWADAFAAGHTALLTGAIRYLAIAVDDELPTFTYSPNRGGDGRLYPVQVTRTLDQLRLDTVRSAR